MLGKMANRGEHPNSQLAQLWRLAEADEADGEDSEPTAPEAKSAEQRLLEGELEEAEFLELLLDRATEHLAPILDPVKLAAIRRALAEQLGEDPSLRELFERARREK